MTISLFDEPRVCLDVKCRYCKLPFYWFALGRSGEAWDKLRRVRVTEWPTRIICECRHCMKVGKYDVYTQNQDGSPCSVIPTPTESEPQ